MLSKSVTRGAHHIGLTVPDLDETRSFVTKTLGFAQVGEVPDYPAAFVSDGTIMITLWQAVNRDGAVPFDRKTVIGLHHLALNVEDGNALDALYQTLSTTDGVAVEFGPEPLGRGPAKHMMRAIPGGIRVEFIAAGG